MSVRRLSWCQDCNEGCAGNRQEQSHSLNGGWDKAGTQDHGMAQFRRRDHPQAEDTRMIPQWAPAFGWVLFCIACGTLLAIVLLGCQMPLR